jgi:hypothetical protein
MRSIPLRQKLLLAYVILALILSRTLGAPALETIHDIAVNAAAAFAISKSINAALSLAQAASISGGVVFAGGSIHPAAFLDPVNNLVDQFASVMLAISVAAFVLELTLRIGGSWAMLALMIAAAVVVCVEPPAGGRSRLPLPLKNLARGALLFTSLGVVGLPVAVSLTGLISERFLEARYAEAERGLVSVEAQTAEITDDAMVDPAEDPGLIDSLKRVGSSAFGTMRQVADGFSTLYAHIVTMITVFALQTVVLPLGLAWIAYRCAAAAVTIAFGRSAADAGPG